MIATYRPLLAWSNKYPMIGSRHIEIRNQSQKLRPDALAASPMNIEKKNHKTKIMKVAFIFTP
ncbi:hypothetical protein [Comamonas thiooxydans]|uniref:hypothetical protein n=1 Tax=Comamonas thiooxydans TaxID=363952 RepID=UPI001CCB473C|nr:hypothetical protein [Comamonas thiooxydans]UBQ43347.1 hypothetical protein LCH15_07700 [Comamonas thiooxydans]